MLVQFRFDSYWHLFLLDSSSNHAMQCDVDGIAGCPGIETYVPVIGKEGKGRIVEESNIVVVVSHAIEQAVITAFVFILCFYFPFILSG